jgi:hypothetical protein
VTRWIVALLLLLAACGARAEPSIAFYYGAEPPLDELKAFDIAVVEPEHVPDPKVFAGSHTQPFAYVSVGEVEPQRPYAKDIPQSWHLGVNSAWGSVVIDQSQPDWPRFFVEHVIAPLWHAGYRAFFLDTLDSYQLFAKTPQQRQRQEAGLVAVIKALKRRYPDAKLILNRGFEILPQVHEDVFAVAAESLFRGWDPETKAYRPVTAADRDWLLARLKQVRTGYRLPVIVIDYGAPAKRKLARETAQRISQLGFIPWVSDHDLNMLGVGSIEVMPRKVLMLYRGDGTEYGLMDADIHRLAATPLNYLGYVADYRDVTQPLPDYPLVGRYAGIVTWFGGRIAQGPKVRDWLLHQIADGMKVAVFENFGFEPATAAARLALNVGAAGSAPSRLSVTAQSKLMGFEAPVFPDRDAFLPLRATDAQPLLTLTADSGAVMDAAALTAWGGYVLAPYAVTGILRDTTARWDVQPIEFLRRALRLPAMPVPDVTTENGRRLMLVHIDGDGFANRAQMPGGYFAPEMLLKRILTRYRVPTTVSVIQGEVAANGLHPKLSPQLEAIARRIFALPYVELASHTFSHPFRWNAAEAAGREHQSAEDGEALPIPGYTFNLKTEITGSIDYINRRLAPPGKKVKVLLWSGNTNPGADAVALTYADGVGNMNGGDTLITRSDDSLTEVAPIGIPKGRWFQVYAPNQNENVYTNDWHGPYYGFQRVIETFELTDKPYRLKPIDIYYHMYSGARTASLAALDKVYRWALAQPVMNIYASEYIAKVLDFRRMVVARAGNAWIVRGNGALRELRASPGLGYPDPGASRGVAGYSNYNGQRYLHLTGDVARIVFTPRPPRAPYLAEANGRITRFERDGASLRFGLAGHLPLTFALGNVAGCGVHADGRTLQGQGNDIRHYRLKEHAVKSIAVVCR